MFYEHFENNRDYQIRKQVTNFLNKLNIETTNAIDLSKIMYRMDEEITWKFVDLDGLPGFTCYNYKKRKYKMFLDEETSQKCLERIIFTIAHELGHIVLKHFGTYDNSTYIMNKKYEYEANIFADELLMPTAPILNKKMTANEICNTYLVSKSAARNKIHYINRNTLYREEKQVCSLIFSLIDKVGKNTGNSAFKNAWRSNPDDEDYQLDGVRFSENKDDYNEKVIEAYLDKWLDPD